jgi:hypothetical protein
MKYARAQSGKTVGSGECFDLADSALRGAGAKSAADFGPVTPDAAYQWGQAIPLDKALPGDILQFSDYEMETSKTKTTSLSFPDGASLEYEETSTQSVTRPHHTAIVALSPDRGTVAVLEQNVERGRRVKEKTVGSATLAYRGQPSKTVKSNERITVNSAWGQQIKRLYRSPADIKNIDNLVKKHLGKVVVAQVEVTESVTVRGTVQAYHPQSR